MAMTPPPAKRGIALLVTVIFMAVMLAFGLTLASISYKQSILAATATESQAAFFAADGALECALYADQREGAYLYSDYSENDLPDPNTLAGYAAAACDGTVYGTPAADWTSGSSGRLSLSERISYDGGTACADVAVYKYANPLPDGLRAFVFATGYNVACGAITGAGARVVSRGIYEKY